MNYEALLRETREDVAYIKAKIEVVPDHESRIRALEKKVWGFAGVATVLSAVAGILISLCT
jgi:hypothetical protein